MLDEWVQFVQGWWRFKRIMNLENCAQKTMINESCWGEHHTWPSRLQHTVVWCLSSSNITSVTRHMRTRHATRQPTIIFLKKPSFRFISAKITPVLLKIRSRVPTGIKGRLVFFTALGSVAFWVSALPRQHIRQSCPQKRKLCWMAYQIMWKRISLVRWPSIIIKKQKHCSITVHTA